MSSRISRRMICKVEPVNNSLLYSSQSAHAMNWLLPNKQKYKHLKQQWQWQNNNFDNQPWLLLITRTCIECCWNIWKVMQATCKRLLWLWWLGGYSLVKADGLERFVTKSFKKLWDSHVFQIKFILKWQGVMQILFGRHSNSKPVLLERGKRYSCDWKVGIFRQTKYILLK